MSDAFLSQMFVNTEINYHSDLVCASYTEQMICQERENNHVGNRLEMNIGNLHF